MSTEESQSTTHQGNTLDPFIERAEQFAKEKPGKALSAAFGMGILLALFPIGSVVTGIVRLAFLLLRPVLVVMGLVKVYEWLGGRCCQGGSEPKQDESH